ncbi:MAG: regulatory signaling modulator protein AmpE [Halioglobus sp.]
MTFLALIIALVLERLSPLEDWLHRDAWFERWQGQLNSLGLGNGVLVILSVGVPVAVAYLVLGALQPLLFGLAWIAAAVVLLLYSIGRGNIGALQERYRSQCRRGDFEAAWLSASSEFDWFEAEEKLDTALIHQRVQQGFLYQEYQRWFAVLFYFLLLGPIGALAYRLLQMTCEGDASRQKILFYLDWVPIRLQAAAFTLTGNFVASADELWDALREPGMSSEQVLFTVAMAATGQDKVPEEADGLSGQRAAVENEMFAALVRRSSVFWVAVIAGLVVML